MHYLCRVAKGNMTAEEAFGAIREISASISNKEHLVELSNKIMEKESPMKDRDEALEKQWWQGKLLG